MFLRRQPLPALQQLHVILHVCRILHLFFKEIAADKLEFNCLFAASLPTEGALH